MNKYGCIICMSLAMSACDQGPVSQETAQKSEPIDLEATMIALVTPDDHGGESLLDAEIVKLRARPKEAVQKIISDFTMVPDEKSHIQHDLIYLLGKLGSDEALPFLESMVFAPQIQVTHSKDDGCHDAHAPEIADYVKHAAAINATIRISQAGSQAGNLSLRRYLKSADKEWAMQVAIWLFDTDQMTDADRGILRARGFPFEFVEPPPEMDSGIDPAEIQTDIAKGKARKLAKLKREGLAPDDIEPTQVTP